MTTERRAAVAALTGLATLLVPVVARADLADPDPMEMTGYFLADAAPYLAVAAAAVVIFVLVSRGRRR